MTRLKLLGFSCGNILAAIFFGLLGMEVIGIVHAVLGTQFAALSFVWEPTDQPSASLNQESLTEGRR